MNMRAQRGQVFPLAGIALVVILAVAGLAVDVGYYRYQERLQQNAADGAAVAGAAELRYSTASAIAAAKADAALNGFPDGTNGITVTVDTKYSSVYTGSTSAVHVTISKSYPKFFEGVLAGGTVPINTSAVARQNANNVNCFYQLDPSGSPNFNGMNFHAPNCSMIMNGNGGNMNNATIDAAAILYAGSAPNENGATFPEARPTQSLPALDPCPDIAGCNYLASNPPSTSGCVPLQASKFTGYIWPGCYTNVNLNQSNVTLNPGLYVVNGAWNLTQSTVSGSGVTIYITANGGMNLNKAQLSLTPPTSGNTNGMLFYEVPGNANAPNFNNDTSTVLGGVLYFPSAHVNYNGSLNSYTVLVVGDVNFNGSNQNFPDPPSDNTYVQQATLAE